MLTVYVNLSQDWIPKRNYFDELYFREIESATHKGGETYSVSTKDELHTLLNSYGRSLLEVVPDKRYRLIQHLTIDATGQLDGQKMRIYKMIHTQQEYTEFIEKLFSPAAEKQELRRRM